MKCPEGIVKRAYDYAQEVDNLKGYAEERQHDEPISWLQSLGFGAAGGAGLGFLYSLGRNTPKPSAGAAIGAGLGLLGGAIYREQDREDIEEQKHIMTLSPEEKRKYLVYKARNNEISRKEKAEDRRTDELVEAFKSR